MSTRLFFLLAASTALALAMGGAAACTGSDPDPAPARGDAGVDTTTPDTAPPGDAGVPDAEAGAQCLYDDPGSDAGFVCQQGDLCADLCCVYTTIVSTDRNVCVDGGSCEAGYRRHECDHPGMCKTGGACCLITYSGSGIETDPFCPRQVNFDYWRETKCIGGEQCPVDGYRMCRTDADCNAGTCRHVTTTSPGGTLRYGLCLQ